MALHWKNVQGPCPAASLTNERQEIDGTECTGLVSGHSLGGVHSPKQRLPLLGTWQSGGHLQLLPETGRGSLPEPERRLERMLYGSSSQHCQMKQILPALQRTGCRKAWEPEEPQAPRRISAPLPAWPAQAPRRAPCSASPPSLRPPVDLNPLAQADVAQGLWLVPVNSSSL